MSRAVLVAGLGFGDEGKGSAVDALVRRHRSPLVVRHNGGAQAAHNVVLPYGKHHCFAQLGSGSFAGAATFLSRHMLVNPISFMAEATAFEKTHGLTPTVYVDRYALVTTPFHVAANRIREMLRTGRHGSCGMGIGETMADFLDGAKVFHVADIEDHGAIRARLTGIKNRKQDEMAVLLEGQSTDDSEALGREWSIFTNPKIIDRIMGYYEAFARRVKIVDETFLPGELAKDDTIVFEGAQGVLLDQDFGFQPYTTWTDCTFGNAEGLIEESEMDVDVTKLGVLRAYHTRHGNGPFPTEDASYRECSTHDHNTLGAWQGDFRSGRFDLVLAKYALDVVGECDGLVVTNLDRLSFIKGDPKICTAYLNHDETPHTGLEVRRPFDMKYQEELTQHLLEDIRPVYETVSDHHYAEQISERLEVPLMMTSDGPTYRHKLFLSDVLAEAV